MDHELRKRGTGLSPTGPLQVPIQIQRLFRRRCPWRFIVVAAGLLASATPSAAEQRQKAPARTGTVTILTDGIAEPNSNATRAINELAKEVGNVRVLPIAGHGAIANVRDRLRRRAFNWPSLNTNIFHFLNKPRQNPKAGTKIRNWPHINTQKFYRLPRQKFKPIASLPGASLPFPRGGLA